MLFPSVSVPGELTRIALSDVHAGDDLPNVNALLSTDDPTAYADAPESTPRAVPLLTEHALNTFTRPGLRGFRITVDDAEDEASAADFAALMQLGGGWTPRFAIAQEPEVSDRRLAYRAVDESAGLELGTELESLAGGSLRIRHTLTNRADSPYVVQGLDVSVPLADNQTELLDFTGRHERERQPQRHTIADGIWSREFRWGKTGFEGPLFVAGTPGFDFAHGSVLMVQPAWSGNNELYVQRDMAQIATVSAGELLEPGEIVLRQGESYATPWIMVTASNSGLDGAAASLHQWERSLPAHPRRQPVVLNVWEGVMFDHNLDALLEIARRAAAIGVERYVLDDGWFHLRRDDHAGLGDWWVDPDVWPEGLHPLVDFVHEQGMQFGLWFEPEMVNPDSDLYREHPDWVLQAAPRTPILQRHQLVLDLANPEAFDHVYRAIHDVLSQYRIDYIKWDHNRYLLEAGSNLHGGAASIHNQTVAYYRLLDKLRADFPDIEWESCASGGGRIDTGVIEHVQRCWTSDMTDALSRQCIQRWTVQNIAPEYLGAHISQPTSQQTGRTYSVAFRAATAVFHSFGIEWDITKASDADLQELASWIVWYKANRDFLHSGRFVRLDVADPAVLAHGVVAADGSRALIAHVQYEESSSNRGVWLRVPGLDADARYALRWVGPEPARASLEPIDPLGPVGSRSVSGAWLASPGVRVPRCRPETVRLVEIVKV